MKAIRSVRKTEESEYRGSERPQHKIGDYLKVYAGSYQDHCFVVKAIRYNEDHRKFEYLYEGAGWYQEGCVVPASSRQGWHYDSQGYCDNPGRGY